jgi:palmitoyl transferase
VLPLVGISYGNLTINSTYIPGGKGNGNVLFTFAHYHF